jgi:hypothetical protein
MGCTALVVLWALGCYKGSTHVGQVALNVSIRIIDWRNE